jgi:hypothetical protein
LRVESDGVTVCEDDTFRLFHVSATDERGDYSERPHEANCEASAFAGLDAVDGLPVVVSWTITEWLDFDEGRYTLGFSDSASWNMFVDAGDFNREYYAEYAEE